MHFLLRLRVEGFHMPTEKWHVTEARHGLRAVSRKHAITKGLRIATRYPIFEDRAGHPDWRGVTAEAEILEVNGVPEHA
jgi:hypothetical protein